MIESEFMNALRENQNKRSRYYICNMCDKVSLWSRRTKDLPYQVCTSCYIVTDVHIKDSFLAYPDELKEGEK